MSANKFYVEVDGKRGLLSEDDCREVKDIPAHLVAGFVYGKMGGPHPSFAGIMPYYLSNAGAPEFKKRIEQWLRSLEPKVRTPLTREALLAWATKEAEKRPTYKEDVWNEEEKAFVSVNLARTPAIVLAEIYHQYFRLSIGEHKSSELMESLLDVHWNGTLGWKTMSVKKLLDLISRDLVPDSSVSNNYRDLESMLEFLEDGVL